MNHLPECGYTPEQLGFGGINSGIDSTQPFISGHPCICDRLRASEQRVREEWYEVQSETWEQGYKYALDAARQVVETYAQERLIKTKHPNKSEDITAALRVAADRIMNMQKDMGQPPSLPPSAGVPERYLT